MPDLDFKTISSSQLPDLLNISSWGTRYTLFHQFRERVFEERAESNRMRIGKLFEKLILELTAEKLALDVKPNFGPDGKPVYVRHPTFPVGCTADADIFCPTRGEGTVEAKAIDKFEWQRSWTETEAPKMYEAQLQHQMLVRMHTWGVIACFVYNEGSDGRLILYERRPHQEAWDRIVGESQTFFDDLAAGKEPSPFGLPVELPIVTEQYPEVEEANVLDATEDYEMAEFARMYAWTAAQAKGFERGEKSMKPKLLAMMKDHGSANLAGGVSVRLRKPQMAGSVVMLPANVRNGLRSLANSLHQQFGLGDAELSPITEACEWAQVLRQPGIQSRLTVLEGDAPLIPEDQSLSNLDAG